jgi:hypothetical protein
VEVFPDGERVRAKYQGVEYDGTILRQIGDTSYEVAFESDEGSWEKTTKREHIRRAEQQIIGLPRRKVEAEPPKADKKSPAPKKTKAKKADDTEKREAEEAKKKDAEKTKKKEAEKTKKAPPKRVQPDAMPSKRSRTVEVFSDGERVRLDTQSNF